MSIPEDDLLCPVCCDIFRDPVLLSCSHSFCRGCIRRYWDTAGSRECPVCRKKASKCNPPSNLALRNLCEAVQEVKRLSVAPEEDVLKCSLHGERFKLFCLVDKQPICVVCQSSKTHKNHDFLPIEEAAQDCKDVLSSTHKNLQDKLNKLKIIQHTSKDMLKHIKSQALETGRMIKVQFEQLHQVLHKEESHRLAALKAEEEEKMGALRDKIVDVSAEMLSLRENISVLEEIKGDDMELLQNFKAIEKRYHGGELDVENMSGALIDVSKHLNNLKYRSWEKMHNHFEYTPVTLDPNTAHPCLILSEDLTSLHYSSQPHFCPDNPERFHVSAEVVGMSALGSGSHRWVVETGSNQDWLLGVTSATASRSTEVSARPENGFWTLCFRDGEFRAMTSPPTALTLTKAPRQVRVQLDYDRGTLCFYDSADDLLIYTFTHTFTDMLLPYFYTQCKQPLRILPENVFVTMLRE